MRSRQRFAAAIAIAAMTFFLVSPSMTAIASSSPTVVNGTVIVSSSTLINEYVKGNHTYYLFADAFTFSGDMSGICTGSDVGFFGIGRGGNYGTFTAQCTFVGTIDGASGTMQISLKSPVGAEFQGNNLHNFSFTGDQGTAGLAGANIRNGKVDPSNQYTANFQFS